MNEKRMNHCRGIVKNIVITQNQRDGDSKRKVKSVKADRTQV